MSQSEEVTRSTMDRVSYVKMAKKKSSAIRLATESDNKNSDTVNWGRKNEYPYYLNYLAASNPIHSGILRAKTVFTVSGGLIYEGKQEDRFELFFKNKKSKHSDKNLEDLVKDISVNYEISNIFVFRVLFNVVGIKTYKKLEVIPFEKVRFEIAYDEQNNAIATGNIKISDNWLDLKQPTKILMPFDKSDPDQLECYVMHMEESGQSLDEKGKVSSSFYPEPLYSGAIISIDTLIQVGKHGNSEIHNGFSLGTLVYLAGGKIIDPKVKREFEDDLTNSTTGAENAGGNMIVYGNGQDERPTIISLSGNNLPDRYVITKKGAEESIIHAHQVVVPTLFGVKQEGSFNASELEVGYAIMQANYFTGRRDAILSVLNWIMNDIAGIEGSIAFGEVQLNLENQVATDDASKTGQALNAMSPLVANKVLSSMTANEIRALAILKPKEGGDELPSLSKDGAQTEMSKEVKDEFIERFKKFGVEKSSITEIFSTQLIDGTQEGEQIFMDEFKKAAFQALSENGQRTLELIKDNENFNNIRKTLDISSVDLAKIYGDLIQKGLITKDGVVTTEGNRQIAINDVTSLQVMYGYRLRFDAPKLQVGGKSREFCQVLIGANRLYTRSDIERISGVEGYDVFAYRGGWYHNPNSGKNEPGCRHEWYQVVTFK